MPTKSSIPSTFLGVESGNYYLRETKQASAPLRNYYSISSTILRSNLADMILHRTGVGTVMPVHAQMDGHTLEDG